MNRIRTVHLLLLLAILVAAGFMLFWKLGATSFRNGDEARYAQSAREMLQTGDYMTVHYQDRPFLTKPPGKVWSILLGYSLFGIHELGARFTSALFALGTIALTVLLGWRLFSPLSGLLAGAILMSSAQFIHEHCGRTAESEPESAFLYALAMLCFWLVLRDRRWLYGLAISLTLLTMMKAPLVAPPVLIFLLYLAITRRWDVLRTRHTILAVVGFLAVVAAWHTQQFVVHGDKFTRLYLMTHVVGRFTGAPPEPLTRHVSGLGTTMRLGFYPSVIFYSLFPWSFLVVPSLVYAAGCLRVPKDRPGLLIFLWVLVYGAAIVLASSKLHWYVVPILPALALLVAEFCRRLYRLRSPALFYGVVALSLVGSLLFLPALDYVPYSRKTIQWILKETNVTSIWGMRDLSLPSLVPALVTGALAVATFVYLLPAARGGSTERAVRPAIWTVFLGSFLFSGLYQTALPLREVAYKTEAARCRDAVRAARVEPERVFFIGHGISPRRLGPRRYFYLVDLAGGSLENAAVLPAIPRQARDREFLKPGTLILSDSSLRAQLLDLGPLIPLWQGEEIDALLVPKN